MAEADESSSATLQRVSTGVAGLDTVVRGGLLEGGIYILAGRPGTGKTILANQACFAHVAGGCKAAYVTVQAESHGRMVAHLAPLRFFRPDAVGTGLVYVSGYTVLKEDGLEAFQRLLQKTVREHECSMLVIDGLTAVEERAGSKTAFREFLHSLAVHNSITRCTTFLLTTTDSQPCDPEHAIVDGVISLELQTLGLKAMRGIEVVKLRGTGQLVGRHYMVISDDGITVYPRTETLYTEQPGVFPDPNVRMAFGIPRLDELIGGGLVAHSSTILLGSPGSGKTVLSLYFLAEGASRGEPGFYFGFSESAAQLVQKAALVGLDIREFVEQGLIRFDSRLLVKPEPDALVHDLLTAVRAHGVRRLVIDGLEPISKEEMDPQRVGYFTAALMSALKKERVTLLTTQMTPSLAGPVENSPVHDAEAIFDNILFLRFFELRSQLYRLFSVLKMRESAHDSGVREFRITSDGPEIAETFESAERILTGLGQQVKVPKKKKRLPPRGRGRK